MLSANHNDPNAELFKAIQKKDYKGVVKFLNKISIKYNDGQRYPRALMYNVDPIYEALSLALLAEPHSKKEQIINELLSMDKIDVHKITVSGLSIFDVALFGAKDHIRLIAAHKSYKDNLEHQTAILGISNTSSLSSTSSSSSSSSFSSSRDPMLAFLNAIPKGGNDVISFINANAFRSELLTCVTINGDNAIALATVHKQTEILKTLLSLPTLRLEHIHHGNCWHNSAYDLATGTEKKLLVEVSARFLPPDTNQPSAVRANQVRIETHYQLAPLQPIHVVATANNAHFVSTVSAQPAPVTIASSHNVNVRTGEIYSERLNKIGYDKAITNGMLNVIDFEIMNRPVLPLNADGRSYDYETLLAIFRKKNNLAATQFPQDNQTIPDPVVPSHLIKWSDVKSAPLNRDLDTVIANFVQRKEEKAKLKQSSTHTSSQAQNELETLALEKALAQSELEALQHQIAIAQQTLAQLNTKETVVAAETGTSEVKVDKGKEPEEETVLWEPADLDGLNVEQILEEEIETKIDKGKEPEEEPVVWEATDLDELNLQQTREQEIAMQLRSFADSISTQLSITQQMVTQLRGLADPLSVSVAPNATLFSAANDQASTTKPQNNHLLERSYIDTYRS